MCKMSYLFTQSFQMIDIILLITKMNLLIYLVIGRIEASLIKPYPAKYSSEYEYQQNILDKVKSPNKKKVNASFQIMQNIVLSGMLSENLNTSAPFPNINTTSNGYKYLNDLPMKMKIDNKNAARSKRGSYRFRRNPSDIKRLLAADDRAMSTKQSTNEQQLISLGISLIIIYSGIIISALLRNVIVNRHLSIGIEVPLFLYGIFIGVCFRYIDQYSAPSLYLHQQKNVLIYLAVPLMMYRGCITADFHGLKKYFFQALFLSLSGLIVNAILVGITMRYVLKMNWSFVTCMYFGIACVIIYSKQNIEMMRQRNSQSQQVAIILEGEFIIGTILSFTLYIVWFRGSILLMSAEKFFWNMLKYFSGIPIGFLTGLVNCYFSWKLSPNIADMLLFSTITPLLVFHLCFTYLKVSGLIVVTICGIMMANERIVLNNASKTVMEDYWQFLTALIDTGVLTTVGFTVGSKYVWFSDSSDYVYMMLIYCTTYFGRFLILSTLSPLSNRLGYNLDSRSRILAVCGGVPSLINICYTLFPSLIDEIDEEVKPILFFYVSGMVVIALILNVISLPYLLSFLKMDVLPVSREEELILCMRYLRKLKTREMLFIKIESLMGETDWARVQSLSSLENPFSKESRNLEDDEKGQSLRYCPDCHKETVIPLRYVEYPKQRASTNLRILKTREAIQVNMFAQHLLSRKSYMVLKGILNRAYDHPNNYLQPDALIKKFNVDLICSKGCLQKYQKWQIFRSRPTEIRPPNFYWRRLCYHMMRSTGFHMTIFGILFFNMVFIITEGFLNPKPSSFFKHTFTFFDAVFLMFYTSEWLINIAGRARTSFWRNGLTEYLRLPSNTFDFIVLLTTWTSFITETLCYINLSHEIFLYENRLWFTLFKGVRMMRLIRIFKYAQSIIKKIEQNYKNQRLMTAFDIGKDFFIQEKIMLNIVPNICGSYHISRDIQEDIDRTLFLVVRELQNVESNFSWISTTVKTKYATKLVINSMRETVDYLVTSGWIDSTENKILNFVLKKMLERVKRKGVIQQNDKELIFGNVPWMEGHPETKKALLEKAEIKKFEAGQSIFQEGDKSNGIYIIITGVCDISYIPEEETLLKLWTIGELPVVDNVLSGKFSNPFSSYITHGKTFGELSFLTNRVYASKVTADSPCEAYFLSSEVLREIMRVDSDSDNGLECRIWKNVSKNIATELLRNLSQFDSEQIQLHDPTLTRFYMPKINYTDCYSVKSFIRDIVLIEGVIEDEITGADYTAPCRIPRTLREITFPVNEVSARLLFIPGDDIDDNEISFQ